MEQDGGVGGGGRVINCVKHTSVLLNSLKRFAQGVNFRKGLG
jgi:hypothetical protein